MKEEKKESPIGVLWGWGKPYHGKFIGSIAPCGIRRGLPDGALFLCGAYCHADVVRGSEFFALYEQLVLLRLCGYLGKVIFSNLSTTISHTATYYTLRDLRENITEKLARVPMGTILDTTVRPVQNDDC